MGLHKLSASEQTASHLKDWLLNKNISDQVPGVDRLSAELGVSRDTVRKALIMLEKEGLIISGGKGKPRLLTRNSSTYTPTSHQRKALRVLIFSDTHIRHHSSYLITHALQLQRQLSEAGCNCEFADRNMADFDHQPERISRYVLTHEADVWIVKSATSEVLEWFEKQSFVTIAWGGRHRQLSLPRSGNNLIPAIRDATGHLISLGHRRIAYLAPPVLRKPNLSLSSQAFLDELAVRGVTASEAYHLPEFDSSPHGLEKTLTEMFRVTPPTALIVGTHSYHLTVLGFLRQHNLRVPEDVSVIAGYTDLTLDWMIPHQAHFHFQMEKIIRRIVKWVEDVMRGKRPTGCEIFDAAYLSGASIGLAAR